MAYIPKKLTQEELKEQLTKEAFNFAMEFFKGHPKKTTCKFSKRIQVRKDGVKSYTLHIR